jgi:hypothetical protein
VLPLIVSVTGIGDPVTTVSGFWHRTNSKQSKLEMFVEFVTVKFKVLFATAIAVVL